MTVWFKRSLVFLAAFLLLALAGCSQARAVENQNESQAVQGSSQEQGCRPTQPDALGPFYQPGAPERDSVGAGYRLSGTVRSAQDCRLISGAQIEFWLAGPNGQYSDDYRATMFSDAEGKYAFESHAPPPYAGRPAHIHIRVSAEGYQTLVTQHYPGESETESSFDLVLVPES